MTDGASRVIVILGPGGVGKGTVVSRLLQAEPRLWLSRSWTTRPRRTGESADAYVFVDEATFRAKVAEGGFLEWEEFIGNGHLYGTPLPDPPPGQDQLFEIDAKGAASIRALHPDALLILLKPPSTEELAARLARRGDAPDAAARRLAVAEDEVLRGEAIADHVVVNDDLDQAVAEVASILKRHL